MWKAFLLPLWPDFNFKRVGMTQRVVTNMKSHAAYSITNLMYLNWLWSFLGRGTKQFKVVGNECLIPSRVEDSITIEISIFLMSHTTCLIKKQSISLLKMESTVFLLKFTAVPSIFQSQGTKIEGMELFLQWYTSSNKFAGKEAKITWTWEVGVALSMNRVSFLFFVFIFYIDKV